MVIRHSLQLLEQLHELEAQISFWEEWARSEGLNLDHEALITLALMEILRKPMPRPLTPR
jgi:hypothetical protein